jgi:hypothetical protein
MSPLMSASAAVLIGVVVCTIAALGALLLLHALMPRVVLQQYWREPYFNAFELAFFTRSIFAPWRTVMLMWLIAFPRFGRARKIARADALVPVWYRVAAKAFCSFGLLVFFALLVAMTGFTVDAWQRRETPPWGETLALLLFVGSWAAAVLYQRRVRRRSRKPTCRP